MKHPRKVTAALVILVLGLGSATVALAQSPANPVQPVTGPPPTATPPAAKSNPETAVATLLADCVKKEQASSGTSRSEAMEACKKRLTTEETPKPPSTREPAQTPNPTRQEDFSSEKSSEQSRK